jgi:hypothetical protein
MWCFRPFYRYEARIYDYARINILSGDMLFLELPANIDSKGALAKVSVSKAKGEMAVTGLFL